MGNIKDTTTEKMTTLFKSESNRYLGTLGIGLLRSYGRYVGVPQSTEKKKQVLIDEIISVLIGEVPPTPRSKRGAPVRDDGFNPAQINSELESIRQKCIEVVQGVPYMKREVKQQEMPSSMRIDYAEAMPKREDDGALYVQDPNAEDHDIYKGYIRPMYKGQLSTVSRVPYLFPLTCTDTGEKIIVPIELIHAYDLHEGDVITCHAQQNNLALIAEEILTINNLVPDPDKKRTHFDQQGACYPSKRIALFDGQTVSSQDMKYLQWLLPIGKGQRGCIVSPPKAGKTTLLLEIAQAAYRLNYHLHVFCLLIDQSPEAVGKFRKIIPVENLLYTTYEDAPERQVFVADFLLQRAKSLAESGNDVLILVDSFNALARAFNETEESAGGKVLVGGIESKTIHYLKKYFGAARCLEGEGSITMLGAVSNGTGNPADDLICSELSMIGNLEIRLNEDFAVKRIYPTIDLLQSRTQQSELLFDREESKTDLFLRGKYLPKYGEEPMRKLLFDAESYQQFAAQIKKL